MNESLLYKIKEYSVYAFFLAMTLAKAVGLDSSHKIYFVIAALASLFWGLSQILSKHTIKTVLKSILIFSLPIISFFYNHSLALILLAMVLIALKDIEPIKVIKLMAILWLSVICLAVIGTLLGIIEMAPYAGETIGQYRWFYSGHNPFHQAIVITFIFYFLIRGKIKWYDPIIISLINLYVFFLSDSIGGVTSGYIVIIGFTLRYTTFKYKKLWKIFSLIMMVMSGLVVVLSLLAGYFFRYGNLFSEKLDKIFTNRVHVMRDILDAYNIPLFGQKMDGRVGYELMDNAYFDIIMEHGIVLFVALMFLYGITFYKLYKKEMYTEIMICSIFFAYGVVEQMFKNCFLNFSLLYLGYALWAYKEKPNDLKTALTK